MHSTTRKSKYKLRRIGKFNYSLTIPPTIVAYLGGYDENKEFFYKCKEGKLIVSSEADKQDSKIPGWNLELNSVFPFAKKDSNIIGYDSINKSYFCYIDLDIQYGPLNNCVDYMKQNNIDIPKPILASLKKYIFETFN